MQATVLKIANPMLPLNTKVNIDDPSSVQLFESISFEK
jgi:hypothetical protein